jgi:hypothetical protein
VLLGGLSGEQNTLDGGTGTDRCRRGTRTACEL